MAGHERRLVVVGGGLAALRAVEAARRAGHTGPLTLVGAEEHAPYDRPPLSKAVLRGSAEPTPFHTPAALREEPLGVDLRLGVPASGLDTEHRELHLADGAVVTYDALVVATGAGPRSFAGEHLAGVHHLRTAQDALAVRDGLAAGARTVVVGAGFIGTEVASAARERGQAVSVVEAAAAPLARAVGTEVGDLVVGLHREAGTDLRLGRGVAGLEERDGRVTGVRLEHGPGGEQVLPADLVVLGVGVAPATSWLAGSGVDLHEDGGVLCDATLATSAPGVWAAGDVAHAPSPLLDGGLLRVEHWTNAAEQGAAAARHALDPAGAVALAPVPYFWSDSYGHRLQLVGTPRAEEVVLVRPPGDDVAGTLALYRRGDRLVGTLAVDGQRVVMRFRRRVAEGGSFSEAVDAADEVVRARAAAGAGAGAVA